MGHRWVDDDGFARDGSGEHEPFKCLEAREGHVGLAVGKGVGHVEDGAVEREALALVDGDGPGQFDGILFEFSVNDLFEFSGLLVERIACVLPDFAHYVDIHRWTVVLVGSGQTAGCAVVQADAHHKALGIDTDDAADGAVDVAMLGVVLDEHHLCALLERQFFLGGVGELGECTFHLCTKTESLARQAVEFALVDGIGHTVVRDEADVAVLLVGLEAWHVTAIEGCECGIVGAAFADIVEQIDKGRVVLAIHLREFNSRIGETGQGVRGEEIGSGVVP